MVFRGCRPASEHGAAGARVFDVPQHSGFGPEGVLQPRSVRAMPGEDLVEKQNAEMGLMPVVSDEESEYGYTGENRHMVQSFLAGERPRENFADGVNVTELLMTAYMSAEQEKTIAFPPPDLESFVPAVARGKWNPKLGV